MLIYFGSFTKFEITTKVFIHLSAKSLTSTFYKLNRYAEKCISKLSFPNVQIDNYFDINSGIFTFFQRNMTKMSTDIHVLYTICLIERKSKTENFNNVFIKYKSWGLVWYWKNRWRCLKTHYNLRLYIIFSSLIGIVSTKSIDTHANCQ